ncbi:unnamed protein product [Brassica oleracea]
MFCLEDNEDEERTIIHIGGEDIHKIVYSEYIPKPKVINLDYKRLFHSPLLVSYIPSLVRIPLKQREANETKTSGIEQAVLITEGECES